VIAHAATPLVVKGVNAQLAILSSPTCAPVIAASRLRKGNVVSGHGAARLVTDAITTARAAGVTGQVMVRADSGYYRQDMIAAAAAAKAWFSVTARMNSTVRQAIAAIDEDSWTPIRYPRAIWDQDEQRWVCRGVRRGDPVHRVHLPPQEAAGGLPAGGAPGGPPGRARQAGPGRAVHLLALPRLRHQLHPVHRPGRRVPPRPRHRRTGHRRAQGRPPGARPFRYLEPLGWCS